MWFQQNCAWKQSKPDFKHQNSSIFEGLVVMNMCEGTKLRIATLGTFTQILRICIQKHCILLSFCARSTSTWALVTCNSYFCKSQGHVVSIRMIAESSQNRFVISRHICTFLSRLRFSKQLIQKLWRLKPRPLFRNESLFTWMAMTVF